jgi:plasmid stabilization system protein ParE
VASERRPRATVRRSEDADRDLELIFEHLFEADAALGEASADALERAAARVSGIEDDMERLADAPQQGALCTELAQGLGPGRAPDLRRVTKRGAVFYVVADPETGRIDVIAVFFGGQDHQRRMLARLLRT